MKKMIYNFLATKKRAPVSGSSLVWDSMSPHLSSTDGMLSQVKRFVKPFVAEGGGHDPQPLRAEILDRHYLKRTC